MHFKSSLFSCISCKHLSHWHAILYLLTNVLSLLSNILMPFSAINTFCLAFQSSIKGRSSCHSHVSAAELQAGTGSADLGYKGNLQCHNSQEREREKQIHSHHKQPVSPEQPESIPMQQKISDEIHHVIPHEFSFICLSLTSLSHRQQELCWIPSSKSLLAFLRQERIGPAFSLHITNQNFLWASLNATPSVSTRWFGMALWWAID